jgi:hypothetical protein
MSAQVCSMYADNASIYTEWQERTCEGLTNQLRGTQEPEGSPSHSQQLATGPYSEPVESNPQPSANLPVLRFCQTISTRPRLRSVS